MWSLRSTHIAGLSNKCMCRQGLARCTQWKLLAWPSMPDSWWLLQVCAACFHLHGLKELCAEHAKHIAYCPNAWAQTALMLAAVFLGWCNLCLRCCWIHSACFWCPFCMLELMLTGRELHADTVAGPQQCVCHGQHYAADNAVQYASPHP